LNWRLAVNGIQKDDRSSMTGREVMGGSPRNGFPSQPACVGAFPNPRAVLQGVAKL
jgi:hypothetical protein